MLYFHSCVYSVKEKADIFTSAFSNNTQSSERTSFNATLLYNELKHIEDYLAHERSSVNLRYSNDWQHIVGKCSFLKNEEVAWIYMIYDKVYNFNYRYRLKERAGGVNKESIDSYKKLQQDMFDTTKGYPDFQKHSEKYNELLEDLHKYIK